MTHDNVTPIRRRAQQPPGSRPPHDAAAIAREHFDHALSDLIVDVRAKDPGVTLRKIVAVHLRTMRAELARRRARWTNESARKGLADCARTQAAELEEVNT